MKSLMRYVAALMLAAMAAGAAWAGGQPENAPGGGDQPPALSSASGAVTPIDHVIVIFDENISFDHYFGTYPDAANQSGEPPFFAAAGTPAVDGLDRELLEHNPNGVNPERLDRSQAMTPDMDHGYTAEQKAFDGGLMDRFVEATGHAKPIVMDYYDGNTVTALWYYAQHFAMSDDSFGTTFGPSSPGALNVVAGQTHGASAYSANSTLANVHLSPGDKGYPSWALNDNGTLFSDVDPFYDMTSRGSTIRMAGKNIGDLLNEHNLTWGWFEGGFRSGVEHANVGGSKVSDYIPHHEPFQYYAQDANPKHLPPSSVAMIGHTDQANHQYGMSDFWSALDAGNVPNVSYLKAPAYEDGHAGYSDPLDEQRWLVDTLNRLEKSTVWDHTAVFISWDDSDGWYDHVMGPIVTRSNDPNEDALAGTGAAGTPASGTYLDRAGYGPRIPLLVISPWAKHNFVAHSVSDQSSILRFIEDNWKLGRLGDQSTDAKAGSLDNLFDFRAGYDNPRVFLDPSSGEPVAQLPPRASNGTLVMAVRDLAQSLDARVIEGSDGVWLLDGPHTIVVPTSGSVAVVDGRSVDLGGAVARSNGQLTLPVDALAHALGLAPVRVSADEIIFRPDQG